MTSQPQPRVVEANSNSNFGIALFSCPVCLVASLTNSFRYQQGVPNRKWPTFDQICCARWPTAWRTKTRLCQVRVWLNDSAQASCDQWCFAFPKGQQLTSRMTPCLLWSQPRTGSTCWTLLCSVSKHVSNFDPELWMFVFIQFDDSFQDNLANDLASFENAAYKQLADKKAKAKTVSKASAKVVKRPNAKEVIQKPSISKATPPSGQPRHGYYGLPPAKGPFGCMRCRAAPKRCANCREPTFEGLRFANRAQWQAWKDAKDCQKKWRANALPLLANFFWCKATYSLPMGLYMPMPMVMEVILDLGSKCSAVCIQPTTFLLSTHFRFGQNKKHWMLAGLCCPSPNQLATRAPRRMGQADGHEAGSHGDGDLDQWDRPLAFHRFQEVGATTGMWTLIRAVHGSATPSKTPC